MKSSNREKLETYRPKLKEWLNDKTCHLDGIAKQEILNIIREEFDPNYHADLYCGICVVKMMEYAFREMDKIIVKVCLVPESESKTETITVDLAPEPIYKKKKK